MTIAEYKTAIQTEINDKLSLINLHLDFYPGGLSDTITLLMAKGLAYLDSLITYFKDQAFWVTASGIYLTRKCADYDITINEGSFAEGEVTFKRFVPGEAINIPAETLVGCNPEYFLGINFKTTEDVVMLEGEATVTAPIQAVGRGTRFNVEPNTIRYLLTSITGIDQVYNTNATTGGVDADTDDILRNKGMQYLQNLSRATNSALDYGSSLVSGVKSIYKKEKPKDWMLYNSDDENVSKTGNWASIEDTEFYYGDAYKTTQVGDYLEYTYYGEKIIPKVGGTTDNSYIEVYIDGFLKTTENAQSIQKVIDLREQITPLGWHTLKLKLVSGELIVDCFRVYSSAVREGEIDIYVDDGSGTASWEVLKNLKTEFENWRACGIKLNVLRAEIRNINIKLKILFGQYIDKTQTKTDIEADIREYITNIKAGGTIYQSAIIGATTCGRDNKVLKVEIIEPTTDIQLLPNEIARAFSVVIIE